VIVKTLLSTHIYIYTYIFIYHKTIYPYIIHRNICDVIVKTLLSTQPFLGRSYKTCKLSEENKCPFTCFEILGMYIYYYYLIFKYMYVSIYAHTYMSEENKCLFTCFEILCMLLKKNIFDSQFS
jgi:hypothetical protein